MTMKKYYKAYRQGIRSAKRYHCIFHYWMNPYTPHTPCWYTFNQGWNDYVMMNELL